jgi:predicted patatin/cPLA2 family phospholipase
MAAALCLAGCTGSDTTRDPLPRGEVETARVPGYDHIRLWGDEIQPSLFDAVTLIDKQVLAAAQAGRFPDGLNRADFLAISGGGDQGAFAAGVLRGWTERGDRPVFEIVTGVSAGALGAPFAFLGKGYDRALKDIYTKFSAGDLYKSRGFLAYFEDALEDTSKLREIIGHYVTDQVLDEIADAYNDGRRIYVLTTNLDAERPVIWDMTAIAASRRPDRRDLFIKVLLASSAVPGIFPPVYFDVVGSDGRMYREMHVDGGVTAQLVFVPPALKVLEIEKSVFGKVRERALHVIRNGKINPEYQLSEPRAISISSRAVTTLVKYEVIADLLRLHNFAQDNNTAFFFTAVPASFDAMSSMDFDTAYAAKLFETGVTVGQLGLWSTTPPLSPEQFMMQSGAEKTSGMAGH